MKITLFRYLIREQTVPLGICFLGACLILLNGRLLQLSRYLFSSSVTLIDVAELISLSVPRLVDYALPLAALIGVLLAFVRLNGDGELIAMRAAGIGFLELLPSVLCVLSLATLLCFCNALFVIPRANNLFESKLRSWGRAVLPSLMKEGAFINIIPKVVFFFDAVNPADLSVEGVLVQDQRQPDVRLTIVAERAQISYQGDFNHVVFRLANGVITSIPDNMENAQAVSFKTYELSLALDEVMGAPSRIHVGRDEMTLAELQRMSRQEGNEDHLLYALEFHNRLAFPFSCLLLGLAGAPLGALFRRRSRLGAVSVGVVVYLAFYVGHSAGKGFGENGLVSPLLAVWAPNICTALGVAYLWTKTHKETPFAVVSVFKHMYPYLRRVSGAIAHLGGAL
jgi:lipopolysaccharide export system permease protein